MADAPRRVAHTVALLLLALAAWFAPTLRPPPQPRLTTARITAITRVPDQAANVVIVRGNDGRIGGTTVAARRLRCERGERVRAIIRGDNLLPDPSSCFRQSGTRPTR